MWHLPIDILSILDGIKMLNFWVNIFINHKPYGNFTKDLKYVEFEN